MNQPTIDADALRAAVLLRNDALLPVRQAAANRFLEQGLPTTRDEDWKYTSLARVAAGSAEWLSADARTAAQVARIPARPPEIDVTWLEFVDGRVGDGAIEAANAELGEYAEVTRWPADAALPDLAASTPMAALNTALLDDAILVRVFEGAALERPIALRFVDTAGQGARTSQVRVHIVAEANSNAAILELHESAGSAGHFAGLLVGLQLHDGASLDHVRLQCRSDHHDLVEQTEVTLASHSVYRHAGFDLGAGLNRQDLAGQLLGPDARFETSGLFLSVQRQHCDNHVSADHRAGNAISRQHYRGLATGRAKAVFNGKAIVRAGADGTDAEQSSHNLLLSETAEIDTKPELEIYADDVKCSHGATVGQLDRRALFYLRSRGFELDEARRMLVRAFAARVFADFPVSALRQLVQDRVDARLELLVSEV